MSNFNKIKLNGIELIRMIQNRQLKVGSKIVWNEFLTFYLDYNVTDGYMIKSSEDNLEIGSTYLIPTKHEFTVKSKDVKILGWEV